MRIISIDKDYATVESAARKYEIRWEELIAAAWQDQVDLSPRQTAGRGDIALAEQYRGLLRAALPLIERAESAAYSDGTIGGRSWGQSLATWERWKRIRSLVSDVTGDRTWLDRPSGLDRRDALDELVARSAV